MDRQEAFLETRIAELEAELRSLRSGTVATDPERQRMTLKSLIEHTGEAYDGEVQLLNADTAATLILERYTALPAYQLFHDECGGRVTGIPMTCSQCGKAVSVQVKSK